MNTTRLAKIALKAFETVPTVSAHAVGDTSGVFDHDIFANASQAEKRALGIRSAESKYRGESAYPWDNYFDVPLAPLLSGRVALDLGSFTGGRSIAWLERYGLEHVTGIDIRQEYVDAANDFAAARHAAANFVLARGERLPFSDCSFDAVLSFDVLEHVQNAHRTLAECHRVLKPGGMLFVVFPGYFQPFEHHLSMVSRTPCLHWFFSGRTLVRAYYEVLAERGEDAAWYRRESASLEPWERGHIINGTTFALFTRMIRQGDWLVVHRAMKPIGSIGRAATRRAWAKWLSRLFVPLVYVPGVQELMLHRITYILQRHC